MAEDKQNNGISVMQTDIDQQVVEEKVQTKTRRVKRVIHCSDGIYEEYSSDEDGVCRVSPNTSLVDPKTMNWIPWISHMSSKALAACDYVGETLTDFLGITTPKYLYEIQEAERMKEEEEAEKKKSDVEMAGWTTSSAPQPHTCTPVSICLPSSP